MSDKLIRRWAVMALIGCIAVPYGMLLLLSLGIGWTFPQILPDRLNLAPWQWFVADRDGLQRAMLTSMMLSLSVGAVATGAGLLIGRAIRRSGSAVLRFLVYLPFVISPVVVATSLYDLLIRIHLAGTTLGVFLSQLIFATAIAAVFFLELWSTRTDRLESLVESLGGGTIAIWKHVVIPEGRTLMVICFFQSALYSWLDYGLVSLLGGGHVVTLTSRLFGYIREASVNHAAMSSLILLLPVMLGVGVFCVLRVWQRFGLRAVRWTHD